MKKILYILVVLFAIADANAQAPLTACCPEFKLAFQRDFDCTKQGSCLSPNGAGGEYTASMCKYSTHSFLVVPSLPGYSYLWVVTGGIPSSTTGNPINITWGGGSNASIVVTITSADGKCVKTIKESICLRDAPQAAFTFNPNNACAGTPILFNNTSLGGSGVYWDFGDGTFASNVNSPTHNYAAAGTYNVTIYVSSDTAACVPSTQPGEMRPPCCGCTSSITKKVTVVAGSPLIISPKTCINQCLCAGDTAEYCVSPACALPYNWTVSGGTIISGAGTQCIKVKWTGPYPTSVSLSAPNCGNPCGNTATLNVPVLVPNIPIQPSTSPVCQNSTQTYTLPAMPGVFYSWTVSGGAILGPNTNTSAVTVLWGNGPTGQVACSYQNPLGQHCSGNSVLNVNIRPVLKVNGPSQSCVGCTAFFSTTGGPVTWSSTTVGVTFSPIFGPGTTVGFPVATTTNTYTIIATGAAGAYCNSPISTAIVVAPKPVLTVSPTTAIACPNTPVKFVAISNVAATPITWVLPAGATMVANTGPQLDTAVVKFSTIPAGGATVTATQNCTYNLNCSQATTSATVQKPAVPTLSPPITNPCIDQPVGYSITNAVAGVTYTWTISNSLGTVTFGQGTANITVLWHGNNAVSNQGVLTVSNCSGSASANITVTVPAPPTITKTGSCFPFTLTSSTAGPYLWSGPGVTGQTTQAVTVTQPGTYTVTINPGAGGSCAQTKTVIVPASQYYVRILPPCIVSACNVNALSVPFTVATNVPSPVCQWYFIPQFSVVPVPAPGGTVCNGFSGTQLGTYYLVVTNPATGCTDTSNRVKIPEDINLCCAIAPCNTLPSNAINFTHVGCSPTNFTGTFTLPPGWSTAGLPVTYCYGDGTSSTGLSLNATHQYMLAGQYTACIVRKITKPSTTTPGKIDTCCVSNCRTVTIPVVAKFTASYNCNTGLLTITDGSSYYPSAAGANYSWSYTGSYTGTFTNGPNQVITPTSSGTFTLAVSITLAGCTSPASMSVKIVLPAATVTVAPNPSCDGSAVNFTTGAGMASYNWQFGDNSFSYMQSPEHMYPGPGTYNGTLTVVTPEGCTVTKNFSVVVQPKPKVTLSPNPVTICPGSAVTLTATMNANGNTMCPTLSSYMFQWYNNGNPAGLPTTSPTFSATSYGNYSAILTGNSAACNCKIATDTVTVNWHPKPVAKIKGNSVFCLTGGAGTVTLANAVGGYATYAWSSNSPGNISFSPNNAVSTAVTVTAQGNYQVFLMVIDVNGCKAYDTLCIYASNSPSVAVTSPAGTLCSGNVYLLQAIPTPPAAPPAGYGYLWSNGDTSNAISVSAPGIYSVTLTNRNTGCSAGSNSIFVKQGPDLRLFPSCCDTICDNAPINIVPPLPLGPGQSACTVYSIVWLDNNVPISPQPIPCNTLNTASLVPLLGLHNISIVVTMNGCTDTSNVFNLYIKRCGGCECKGVHWGEITVSDGVSTTSLSCGKKPYEWKCKTPFIINAAFNCDPQNCSDTATYLLTLPTGQQIPGTLPLNYTPMQSGTYTVALYGNCGNNTCDTCLLKFNVKCVEDTNCCRYQIKVETGSVAYTPTTNATIAAQTFTFGGLTGVSLTEVRAEVVSYDLSSNYKNECLGCKTLPFTWASINKAGNIGAVPPKITLYGGATTAVFNPTGAAVYQNPREVIWNNGSSFMIGGPIGISFFLPPAPTIECCEIKGKICVKFIFRDDKCRECEVLACFEFSIPKK